MADGGAPILALYRRYRPDTFAEVVGQDHAIGPIMAALSKGRINHAYLFSGPRGCGKTTSARVLARSLNCIQGPTPAPCGECPSCIDLANGGTGSLDVIEIDAASHRGIDDARDLRDRVAFSPVRDRYKVVIIDEAHQITADAFSALLKVVEEPPEHVVFVFATTEPEKVLGTIRSRTHHFPFRLVPPARLLQHLEDVCRREGVTVEPAALSLVIRAGGGSVRDSMSVLDQLIAGADGDVDVHLATALLGYVPESLLDDLVDALAAVDGAAAFASVHHAVESGHDPRRYTNELLERLRTLVIVSRVGDGAAAVLPEVPEDAFERLRHQASRFGHAELSRAADVVAAALGEMAGATSPRLLLELLVARLLVVGADADGAIATRVERLERQLTALGEGGAITPRESRAAGRGAGTGASTATPDRPTSVPAAAAPVPPVPVAAAPPAPAPPASAAPAAAPVVAAGDVPRTPVSAAIATTPADSGWPTPAAPQPPVADEPPPPMPDAVRVDHHTAPGDATPGGVTVEVVRRTWDQVVDRLRTIRRLTWTLVSENAQVLALDSSALTLGFPTPGLADAFNQRGHSDCVKEALLETLGVERKVVGVVGGRAAAPATQAGPDGRADEPADGPTDEPGPDDDVAPTGPSVGPSGAPPSPGGADRATEQGRTATPPDRPSRPVAAAPPPRPVGDDGWPEVTGPSARQAPPATRAAPVVAAEPEQPRRPRVEPIAPEPQVEDVISLDDPSADVEGASHGPDVLARLLGAQVIEDRRTDG
jgi:DNA polymerase-3 subunit gamma/tau